MRYGAQLFGLLLVAACRSGDSPPSDLRNIVEIPNRHQHQTEIRQTRHELGRHVYNFRCYFCHGYSGNALTVANSFLDPKPRDFTRTDPNQLGRDRMLDAVTRGRPNTAMKAFGGLLTQDEIANVVDFVREEFMIAKSSNTQYHTKENGWPHHARYQAAFPFARGEISLGTPWEKLSVQSMWLLPRSNMGPHFLTSVPDGKRGQLTRLALRLAWHSGNLPQWDIESGGIGHECPFVSCGATCSPRHFIPSCLI